MKKNTGKTAALLVATCVWRRGEGRFSGLKRDAPGRRDIIAALLFSVPVRYAVRREHQKYPLFI